MVLEEREGAEVVNYPVIWEEVEDPSNVIDYNIREEQTIDTNSVINANNQTTTGMATVIPWVNAPKLIANTSIYWIKWADPSTVIIEAVSSSHPIWSFTYVSTVWNYWSESNKLIIPEKWTYSIVAAMWDSQLWYQPNTEHYDDYQILVNWTVVEQIRTPFRLKWELRCALELNKWDEIQFNYIYDNNPTAAQTRYLNATVTKLW